MEKCRKNGEKEETDGEKWKEMQEESKRNERQ